MKLIKNLFVIAALFTAIQVSAQTDTATTIRLVNAKNFIFNATTASPLSNMELNAVLSKMQGGIGSAGVVQLSGSQYKLTVTPDSVDAYLPYYGRSYTAPLNPNDSGIKFSSKKFSYTNTKKKKGNWVITIRPKDTRDINSLTIHVSTKGYASVTVNSNSKQSISFNGYISDPATVASK
ncbi:DUF4251 domain-containing protein [Pedobacter metabolipauper]|uniref:Uncharacterized protein DUF4251 n=1 Tax=Pedobacter metabolipauper TaxID=425513 RepID=A0A4R6SPM6_9SPHI|nr:DUF4251 domain-containing protein [Pedobacter metabolipauper]TDQ06559.1 uncharacterized protein DUF4251 [Pedobacter metabolipauper]